MAESLMENAVMAHQRFRHMAGSQDASKRMFFLQISGRTDAGQHGRVHVA